MLNNNYMYRLMIRICLEIKNVGVKMGGHRIDGQTQNNYFFPYKISTRIGKLITHLPD